MIADKAVHVYFEGVVQGVGFRFTARYIAQRYKVKGWVKNLADGRVELEAEGGKDNIDSFISGLKNEFRSNIASLKIEDTVPTGRYKDFQVRF